MEDFEDLYIGNCEVCKKEVKGEAVDENGNFFHVQCFVCQFSDAGKSPCRKSLQDSQYFWVNNKRTCPQCYSDKVAAACYKCGEKIVGGKKIEIEKGKVFHFDCFSCVDCKTWKQSDINSLEFVFLSELNGYVCRSCYFVRYPQRLCYYCEEVIEENAVQDADAHFYHLSCFTCDRCEKALDSEDKNEQDPDLGQYVDFSGNVYCPSCYNGYLAPKCGICFAVLGTNARQLVYKDETYCDVCFACHKCGMNLSGQEFFESIDDKKTSAKGNDQMQPKIECATQDLKGQCLTFCE